MGEGRNMKVKMQFHSVSCYLFVFTILEVAVKSQMSSNSNSHTFMQDNSDVRYLVDNIPVTVHKEFTSSSGVRVQTAKETASGYLAANGNSRLKFEPAVLDFKQRHLGVPHHEKVTVINLDGNKTVYMSSISGNTVHFHSSFFEDKIIPPLGNTSFNVVFLGREEGEVENYLFIHTSEGTFKYDVKGASIGSPYRLRPLSGVRLPLNASYSPVILMHNPHDTPLQLVEVYSSGGEFHLELPGGELEGSKQLWEIPAFLTKPVIRVRFHALSHKNHTAYIRLKINKSEEVLVVPVEVEVGAAAGLYSPNDLIDFGIGGIDDPPTKLPLMLSNSWKKPIRIQNIISTPVSKSLKIDFEPIKVPPDSKSPIQVAMLTYDWHAGLEPGLLCGRIVVKAKGCGSQKLVIPYTALVLKGGLAFDKQATSFRSDRADTHAARHITLTNNYHLPLAITNVTLRHDASKHFQLSRFSPMILAAGERRQVVMLSVRSPLPPDLTLDSAILVHSNVSTLSIPLLSYNGRLNMVIESSTRNETGLDLGLVGVGSRKEATFVLENRNPVPVLITSWGCSPSLPSSTLRHILPPNATNDKPTEDSKEWLLVPGGRATFTLEVIGDDREGSGGHVVGSVWVSTEFETIEIETTMNVQPGALLVHPQPILFDDCFPGKVCWQPLVVESQFGMSMSVQGVSAIPPDPRLTFHPSPLHPPPPTLHANSVSEIGVLRWDTMAANTDAESSYLGLSTDLTVGGIRWADTISLPVHTRETDIGLLSELYERYTNASAQSINLSLKLDTTEVRGLRIEASVQLRWPRLLSGSVVFPLTQVGNTSYLDITLVNPATLHPTLVQVVLEPAYPMVSGILSSLPEPLRPECLGECVPSATSTSSTPMEKEFFVVVGGGEGEGGNQVTTLLLPPAHNATLTLAFTPTTAHAHPTQTLLLVRNNLTALEAIHISGQGAHAQFKFGNRKPGSTTPLLFELAEKHLKDCEREKQRKSPAPNLTVKRSFTARNTGALPLSVYGFYISGLPCEGYGFKVLNCQPFQLAPNSTRKVDIAFSPDFTLARVQRLLSLWTSEGSGGANYSLVATLPPYLLAPCASVLARPSWEPLLYYSAVTFMLFLLCCVIAAAYLESDRTLKCALIAMSRTRDPDIQPVLDLRFVAWGGMNIGNGVNGSSASLAGVKGGVDGSAGVVGGNISSINSTPQSWTSNNVSSCGFNDQEPLLKNEFDVLKSSLPLNNSVCAPSAGASGKKRQDRVSSVSKRNSGDFDDHTLSSDSQRRESWANVFNRSHLNQNVPTSSQSKGSSSSSSLSSSIYSSSSSSSMSSNSSSSSSTSSSFSATPSSAKADANAKAANSHSGSGSNNSSGPADTHGTSSHSKHNHHHLHNHTTSSTTASSMTTSSLPAATRCPLIPILRASDLNSSNINNNNRKSKAAAAASSMSATSGGKGAGGRSGRSGGGGKGAVLGEDETSSTTTESSGHDDGESKDSCKRRDDDSERSVGNQHQSEQRSRPARGPKSDIIEEEGVAKKANNRQVRKANNKSNTANGKAADANLVNGKQNSKASGGSGGSGNAKTQSGSRGKDKPGVGKRRNNEKTPLAPTKSAPEPGSSVKVIRASFSDVVARTPTESSYSSIVAPRNPVHSTSTPPTDTTGLQSALGPIGPKKLRDPVWKTNSSPPEQTSLPLPTSSVSSSLFTDSFCDQPTTIGSNPQVRNSFDNSVWSDSSASGSNATNLVLKVLQEAERHQQQQQQQQQHQQQQQQQQPQPLAFKETWPGVNSLWDTLYSPPRLPSVSSVRGGEAPLMWGSDVWAPTPPPATPWAPPGLAPPPANTTTQQQQQQQQPQQPQHGAEIDQGLDYHPFRSLSNIWTPSTAAHSTIWHPPTTN